MGLPSISASMGGADSSARSDSTGGAFNLSGGNTGGGGPSWVVLASIGAGLLLVLFIVWRRSK